MSFDPKQHLIQLKGKDYLETKWRLVWFREVHPQGAISTEMLSHDPLVIRAVVLSAEGQILATGHGSATAKAGAVWSGREIEKAETAAIGRALGHAGYGTQFEADNETDHLADSPNARSAPPPNSVKGAGLPKLTPVGAPVSGDPLDWTGEPNVYICTKLRVNVTRTATMFLLQTAKGDVNIVVPPVLLAEVQVNGMFAEALAAGVYPLDPAWKVTAELEGNTWRIDAVDTGVPA